MFKEIFKEAFNGAKQANNFQHGFDDAITGKPAQSDDSDYEKGYGLAYELQEKESGKCQSI